MYKLRETSRSRFDDWFAKFALLPSKDNPNIVRPHLQLSIAGYDLENGKPIPRLYSMVSNYDFAPNLHDFGFVVSGLVQYALYLLNRLYSINMDTEALKHLGAYVITETATQDGRVGGPVQMAVITPAGAPTMLNKVDVQSIITQNEERSDSTNYSGVNKKIEINIIKSAIPSPENITTQLQPATINVTLPNGMIITNPNQFKENS